MFSDLKPTTKSSRFILLPVIGLFVLAGLWSIYWFVAAAKVEEILTTTLARQQARGLTITCGNRTIQGFPFKFLLNCEKLKVVRETPTRLTTLTASRLVAAVMAYNYNHMISEIYGPFEITRGRKNNQSTTDVETRKLFSGNAQTIQASVVLKNNALKQSTIIIKGLAGDLIDYTVRTSPQTVKTNLEEAIIHVRATGSMSEPIGPYETGTFIKNLSLVGGAANIQSTKGTKFEEFILRTDITNVPYTLRGKPLDLLKIWRDKKGQIDITELSARSNPVELKGTGNVTLDATSRPKGVVNMQVSGLDELVKSLVVAGKIREQEASLGLAAIKLLGGNSNKGVKIALRATKGKVYFGPFLVAKLKPLIPQ